MDPLQPAIITIFGITGDLARRKLLPALYQLAEDNLLPRNIKIVGVTRSGTTVEAVIEAIRKSVEANHTTPNQATLDWLANATSIVTMDITGPAEYTRLKKELDAIEEKAGQCLTRLFYLAIPSNVFTPVVTMLGEQGLRDGCQHGKAESRLLIEKPFGYDLTSAEELVQALQKSFNEAQIYRIDHYVAKETVQNLLTFRFQNPLFSEAWGKEHISHIIVTAAEAIGIEGRSVFYDQTGALRDLIQSHLLQLVALVAMDQPKSMAAGDIHDKKTEVLRQLMPPPEDKMDEQTVRGQYKTYKTEVDNAGSQTETYAAIRFLIDNDRWRGVPIIVRTGKALAEKVTEIAIVYKSKDNPDCTNTLTIRIQPNEGIILDLRIKKPGFEQDIEHVQMDFYYNGKVPGTHPEAYERVLVDALRGDKTLFTTSDEVLASWKAIEPVLQAWQANRSPMHTYENGSQGPAAQELLLRQ